MADAKIAFITQCNQNAAVYALFGNRITAHTIPDGQLYPHARVMVVSNVPSYSHDKRVCGRKIRLQVDVYAETLTSADASMAALETAFSGYKGMLGQLEAGYVFAKQVNGDWNENTRMEHRILELEIGTND
jgi:hypothetical protein